MVAGMEGTFGLEEERPVQSLLQQKSKQDIAHVQTKVVGIKAGTNSVDVESIKFNSQNMIRAIILHYSIY